MKLSMPTVKGYGHAMRVHGMYGGLRQHGPVKFGGLRQRGPVQFGGRKRRRVARRPLQGGMARAGYFSQRLPVNSYSFAHGRKRRVRRGHARHRRVHRGRGFLDTLKNIGSKALGVMRSVPIASTALSLMGPKAAPAAGIARSLGFARRRRRRGHARKRRVKRGHGLLSSLLGMTGLARHRRRRRVGMAKRRRVKRGHGLLSGLLGMTGLARRRRRVKRGGARKRKVGHYRRLLNVPHF
jgi:hypothetical protein